MKTLLKLLVVAVVLSSCSTYHSAYHYEPMCYYSVPLNTTDKTRHSLAFNVVPTIGFGDEKNLTELKFN